MSLVSCIVWHLLINNPCFIDVDVKSKSHTKLNQTDQRMRATNSGDDTFTFRYLTVAKANNINFQFINNEFYTENKQTSKTVAMQLFNYNVGIVYRIASNLRRINVSLYSIQFNSI